MSKYILHIITLLVLLITACSPQPEAKQLLRQAQKLVDTHPDSAMHLIDSIFYPEASLNRKQYMEFLVTQVQAKYKTYRPVAEDTLIFIAKDYFTKHNNDLSQTALAWFYSGCVYREQQRFDQAMQHFKKAKQLASQTDNNDLKALIKYNMGDLLSIQGLYREALEQYKDVANLYTAYPKKQVKCYSTIGRMFLLLDQQDSTLLYFQKGLEIAKKTENKELYSLITQNLSVLYTNIKEYELASEYLQQSYNLNSISTEEPRYYLNFATIYSGINLTDSVSKYTKLLKQYNLKNIDDLYLKSSIYSFLADYEKSNNNFNAAFDYQHMYTTTIENIAFKMQEQSVYEIQKKYDYELLKNQYQYRKGRYRLWIITLLVAIIAGVTSFSWFTIRQKNRFLYVQQQVIVLKEIASDLRCSKNNTYQSKTNNIRDLLLWKMDLIKKSVQLEHYTANHNDSKLLVNKFYKIIYGDDKADHWQNILSVFDELNPNISLKIKKKFPDLTENEFKLTVLTFAEMTVKDISIILDLSPNTVQTYRNRLRKKIKIEDTSIDTLSFLRERLR